MGKSGRDESREWCPRPDLNWHGRLTEPQDFKLWANRSNYLFSYGVLFRGTQIGVIVASGSHERTPRYLDISSVPFLKRKRHNSRRPTNHTTPSTTKSIITIRGLDHGQAGAI